MNSIRAMMRVVAALLLAVVAGCATTGGVDRHTAGPKDPYEPFNRKMFAFNDTLDTYALKPVATAYKNVVPSPVRTGVHNFFGNFSDAWSAVNQLLQGKAGDAATMSMRVLTNTTIGIAGLFDPATEIGLERKSEDLGQTLGRWGLEPGPYLVLPLFGSSDIRDGLALPADSYVTPALLVPSTWQKIGVGAVGVIDTRAGLLGASQMLDDLAFDRYTFMRDAYVARRRSLVYDGNPPDLPDTDDSDDTGKSAPAPEGAASGAQGGLKPVLPATPASGVKASTSSVAPATVDRAETTGGAARVASAAVGKPAVPPSSPGSTPTPPPLPGGVTPAPLPASAPSLPVPLPGPAPVPPPPASAAHS